MMEIPIYQGPDVFNSLISEFKPYFKSYRGFNQFKKIANAMIVSDSRSIAHLNGINIDHTNQSNLNRFIRSNYDENGMFKKLCEIVNRIEEDTILAIDDTIIEKSGKNIEGADWFYDHSKGKNVWGIQAVTTVASGEKGIYPLIWQQYIRKGKAENFKSKIDMQKEAIEKCIEAGLNFSAVAMDSWYFENNLVKFIESKGKAWVAECKNNRLVLYNDKWIKITELIKGTKVREMASYKINGKIYQVKQYILDMKGLGKVNIVISLGINCTKILVTNNLSWLPKKVIEIYLRRWDIEVNHREMKGNGLKKAWLKERCGITSYMMLNALVQTILEISTIISLSSTHFEFRSVTPEVRYRWVVIDVVMNLIKGFKNLGTVLLERIINSIANPYKSTMVMKMCKIAKL
ncbi:MAG: transposase [Thermoplasmata archaeon]